MLMLHNKFLTLNLVLSSQLNVKNNVFHLLVGSEYLCSNNII